MRRQIAGLYGILIVFNIVVWIWALHSLGRSSSLMGMALLAYSFGLRHAFDADHIAAIDNVTRKTMESGKRPLTIGLMFSLGHSTVVVLATAVIGQAADVMSAQLTLIRAIGEVLGTLFSTFFLFAVAATNLSALLSAVQAYMRRRDSSAGLDVPANAPRKLSGPLRRMLQSALANVTKRWHMYVLGLLFGLGFDTATEIGLLSLSAEQAAHGMSLGAMLVFPALFTAAMTVADATDGLLMVGAYGWGLGSAAGKLRYNIAVTTLSVAVAVVIGSLEGVRLLGRAMHMSGGVWASIGNACDAFSAIGVVVVALFLLAWGVAVTAARRRQAQGPFPASHIAR